MEVVASHGSLIVMILSLPKTSPAGHPPRNVLVRRLPRFDKFQRRLVTGLGIVMGLKGGAANTLGVCLGICFTFANVGVITYPKDPWDWYNLATWMVVFNGEIW